MSLIIISKREGFRRCGEAHSAKETIWPADHFSEEQVKALEAEPMLVVGYLDGEDDTSEAPKRPEKDEDVIAAIVAIVGGLDEEKDFTATGTPKVAVVEKLLKYNVSGKEVMDAFAQYENSKGND